MATIKMRDTGKFLVKAYFIIRPSENATTADCRKAGIGRLLHGSNRFVNVITSGKRKPVEKLPSCSNLQLLSDGRWVGQRWLPYNCELPSAVDTLQKLLDDNAIEQSPFWLHMYGDSVTRGVFVALIRLLIQLINENYRSVDNQIGQAYQYDSMGKILRSVIWFPKNHLNKPRLRLIVSFQMGWLERPIQTVDKLRMDCLLLANSSAFTNETLPKSPKLTTWSYGSHTRTLPIIESAQRFKKSLLKMVSIGYETIIPVTVTTLNEPMVPSEYCVNTFTWNTKQINAINEQLRLVSNELKNITAGGKLIDLFPPSFHGMESIFADASHPYLYGYDQYLLFYLHVLINIFN